MALIELLDIPKKEAIEAAKAVNKYWRPPEVPPRPSPFILTKIKSDHYRAEGFDIKHRKVKRFGIRLWVMTDAEGSKIADFENLTDVRAWIRLRRRS